MIIPILCYVSDPKGFHAAQDVKRVQSKFLKLLLGVKNQTTNVIVYGEFGKMPLSVIRKIHINRYWCRITKYPSTLIFKLFNMRDVHNTMINTWSLSVKSLFDEIVFSFFISNNVSNIESVSIIQRIKDQYVQNWTMLVNMLPKLDTYIRF